MVRSTIVRGIGLVSLLGLVLLAGCTSTNVASPSSPSAAAPGGPLDARPSGPTVASFTANPSSIPPGGASRLAWRVTGAPKACTINWGVGPVTCGDEANGGSTMVSPDETTTYTLTVAGPGGAASASATVTVGQVAGPAHHLAFAQQPTNTASGSAISPAVTVLILDQFNNLTTSTANVTLAIGSNPAGGTLTGSTTVSAVGGRATFGTLSIATPGSGYTLTAASSGLSGATSVAFTITAAQTTTTLVAVPTVTTGGSLVTFTATVTSNGDRVGAGTVTFALSTCTSPIPGGSNIALVGGAAVFMTTTLAVGTHDIVGCYSGGTDGTTTFAGSQSSAVTVVIMSGSG